jgi:hypothetical protein
MLNKDLQIQCRNVQQKKKRKASFAPYVFGLGEGGV